MKGWSGIGRGLLGANPCVLLAYLWHLDEASALIICISHRLVSMYGLLQGDRPITPCEEEL